jgi:hypothetical protein
MTPSAGNTPRRLLTAGEYATLARHAGRIASAADPGQRGTAQAAAVQAARRYRRRGVGWAEIAHALGVTEATLRDWRGSQGLAVKPSLGPGTGHIIDDPARAAVRSQARLPLSPTAYLAMGSMKASGNDFACEIAAIRRVLRLCKVEAAERCAVEISELRQDLNDLRPAVVHVAAHFNLGSVHLSLNGETAAILTNDLCRVIHAVKAPPDLVVLNGCDTWTYADQLTRPDAAGIVHVLAAAGWRGQVTDAQARLFAERFYGELASGREVGTAFETAALTVTIQWPGQGEPRLDGFTGITPLSQQRDNPAARTLADTPARPPEATEPANPTLTVAD